MLNLSIETNDAHFSQAINFFYTKALKSKTLNAFIQILNQIPCVEVGRGGNHIWIADVKKGKRLAIVTDLPWS